MKSATLLLVSLSCLLAGCYETADKPTSVALPLTVVDGYGPFEPGFGILRGEEVAGTEQTVTGIPTYWTNVKPHRVALNYNQLIYQNYYAGNISQTWYDGYIKKAKLEPDARSFSQKPIKCYVHTLRGFDTKRGVWSVMIDTNNNLDFSDETAFEPDLIKPAELRTYQKPQLVQYEVVRGGRIQPARLPMIVKRYGDDFFYNFPQHFTTHLSRNGHEYELVLNSAGFTRPDFSGINLAKAPDWFWQKKVSQPQLVEAGENITLGDVTYKNKGVDPQTRTLLLEPVDGHTIEYLLQEGARFRPFAAREFTTNQPISLASFAGKYVYVDFWGTWCKGCVEDVPTLKALYKGLDQSRFAFVGIVAQDSPKQLGQFLKKHGILWPQILSDQTNKLVDNYPLTGYPTTVLLDPNGVIIAKDLRGKRLADKLAELSRR